MAHAAHLMTPRPSRSQDEGEHHAARRVGILRLSPRVAATVMGITPIIAIWMFFATYRLISFSWVWLVAIPIVGVVIYGPTAREPD